MACEWGFFYLLPHNLSEDLTELIFRVRAFYRLLLKEKSKTTITSPGRGWDGVGVPMAGIIC